MVTIPTKNAVIVVSTGGEMSQLVKLELLSLLRDTARRMRENADNPPSSLSLPMLKIAKELEQEAHDLEVTALGGGRY